MRFGESKKNQIINSSIFLGQRGRQFNIKQRKVSKLRPMCGGGKRRKNLVPSVFCKTTKVRTRCPYNTDHGRTGRFRSSTPLKRVTGGWAPGTVDIVSTIWHFGPFQRQVMMMMTLTYDDFYRQAKTHVKLQFI